MKNLRLFGIIQTVLIVLGSLVLLEAIDKLSSASYALGSSFVLGNIYLTAFVWSRLIQKKLIALSVTIIVFKYAILGIIIYKLLSVDWIRPGWFCVGLGSLVVSVLFFGFVAPTGDETIEENK